MAAVFAQGFFNAVDYFSSIGICDFLLVPVLCPVYCHFTDHPFPALPMQVVAAFPFDKWSSASFLVGFEPDAIVKAQFVSHTNGNVFMTA